MTDRMAPEGKVWLCMMCGKTTKDMFGEERGWDESCALNCIAVDEATKRPTDQEAREFGEERERRLTASFQRIEDFTKSLRDEAWKPDPELLAGRRSHQEKVTPPPTTGWPAPELCQDQNRKLFRWFADRLGSRRLVREAGERIRNDRGMR